MALTKKQEELLEAYENGELEWWDSGNYDDAFSMGYDVGYATAKREYEEESN